MKAIVLSLLVTLLFRNGSSCFDLDSQGHQNNTKDGTIELHSIGEKESQPEHESIHLEVRRRLRFWRKFWKIQRKYRRSGSGCTCWFKIDKADDCACCESGSSACGYPMHKYCRKPGHSCPGLKLPVLSIAINLLKFAL